MREKDLIWVVGGGGMLGSNLAHELSHHGFELFVHPFKLNWNDKNELFSQIDRSVEIFSQQASKFNRWIIFWAAGVSSMVSSEYEVAREIEIFKFFTDCIQHSKLASLNGMFSIASSAGAIYASSELEVISEDSQVSPNTFYAHGKLKQEQILVGLSTSSRNISTSIFRISTLYGYRGNGYIRQGLIGALAQKILNREEIEIFVPLNTYRDFVHVEDASYTISNTLKNISRRSGNFLKIVASEKSYSIEQVLAIFRVKTNQPIKVKVINNHYSDLYRHKIHFRSNSLKFIGDKKGIDLEEGIADLINKLSP